MEILIFALIASYNAYRQQERVLKKINESSPELYAIEPRRQRCHSHKSIVHLKDADQLRADRALHARTAVS